MCRTRSRTPGRRRTLDGGLPLAARARPVLRIASAVVLGASLPAPGAAQEAHPRNVVVMIADGAGVAHWTLARFAREDLAVGEFPVGGLVDTRGHDHVVTGSAAGATALSTGTRTFFGAVAVGPDSTSLATVLEAARVGGMATGLVTTASIADATPAAFGAHAVSRNEQVSILRQMLGLPVDVLMGGGRRVFEVARERAGIDLWAEAAGRYEIVESPGELEAVGPGSGAPLLGVFARGEMPLAAERSPSLPAMVGVALDRLAASPEGFFLMVENEGTDTQAHDNADREILVAEMLDFDDAVRLVLEYHYRDPRTLVVVTADHETGGTSLVSGPGRIDLLRYSTGGHSAAFVPLFAVGPGAERFGGLKENREVGRLLLEAVRR